MEVLTVDCVRDSDIMNLINTTKTDTLNIRNIMTDIHNRIISIDQV